MQSETLYDVVYTKQKHKKLKTFKQAVGRLEATSAGYRLKLYAVGDDDRPNPQTYVDVVAFPQERINDIDDLSLETESHLIQVNGTLETSHIAYAVLLQRELTVTAPRVGIPTAPAQEAKAQLGVKPKGGGTFKPFKQPTRIAPVVHGVVQQQPAHGVHSAAGGQPAMAGAGARAAVQPYGRYASNEPQQQPAATGMGTFRPMMPPAGMGSTSAGPASTIFGAAGSTAVDDGQGAGAPSSRGGMWDDYEDDEQTGAEEYGGPSMAALGDHGASLGGMLASHGSGAVPAARRPGYGQLHPQPAAATNMPWAGRTGSTSAQIPRPPVPAQASPFQTSLFAARQTAGVAPAGLAQLQLQATRPNRIQQVPAPPLGLQPSATVVPSRTYVAGAAQAPTSQVSAGLTTARAPAPPHGAVQRGPPLECYPIFPPPEACLSEYQLPYQCSSCGAQCGSQTAGGPHGLHGRAGAGSPHGPRCPSCYWVRVALPDGPYNGPHAYVNTMGIAALQEVHMQLGSVSARYWRAYLKAAPMGSALLASAPGVQQAAGAGGAAGAGFDSLQRICRESGLAFYSGVDLCRTVKMDADERARKDAAAQAAKEAKQAQKERQKAKRKKEAKKRKDAAKRARKGGAAAADNDEEDSDSEDDGPDFTPRHAIRDSSIGRPVHVAANLADAIAVLEGGDKAVVSPGSSPHGPHPGSVDTGGHGTGTHGQAYAMPNSPRLFLKFDKGDTERIGGAWSKDDLWIVSTTASFGYAPTHAPGYGSAGGGGQAFPQAPAPAIPSWKGGKGSSYGSNAYNAIGRPNGYGKGGNGYGGDFFSPVPANSQFTILCRAGYHGQTDKGMLLLLPLCGTFSAGQLGTNGSVPSPQGLHAALAAIAAWPASATNGPRCVRVCALRVPDVNLATDAPALATLAAMRLMPRGLPLLPCLLSGPRKGNAEVVSLTVPSAMPGRGQGRGTAVQQGAATGGLQDPFHISMTRRRLESLVSSHITSFNLNGDQSAVLRAAAAWFTASDDLSTGTSSGTALAAAGGVALNSVSDPASRPVLLLHGVFGSGKSHTLVAVLSLLSSFLAEAEAGASSGEHDRDGTNVDDSTDHRRSFAGASSTRPSSILPARASADPGSHRMDDEPQLDLDFDDSNSGEGDDNSSDGVSSDQDGSSDADADGHDTGSDHGRGRGHRLGEGQDPDEDEAEDDFCDREPDWEPTASADMQHGDGVPAPTKKRKRGTAVAAAKAPIAAAGRRAPQCRILLAAGTNVAVDRVLTGLLQHASKASAGGDTIPADSPVSFVRVGSARRVAPSLLPYLLPARLTAEAGEAAARDLEGVLQARMRSGSGGQQGMDGDALGDDVDTATLQGAIGRLRRTADCATQLATARIVGVTCAACTFPVLDGLLFPIVVLDESSQLPEVTSLLPVARFGAARLMAVGDPQQLPPVLASPPVKLPPQDSRTSGATGPGSTMRPTLESSTLFERLARLGWPVLRLMTQYRCPRPTSSLVSRLFYSNMLKDGPNVSDTTAAVLQGVPSLVILDYSGWSAAAAVANRANGGQGADGAGAGQSQPHLYPTLGQSLPWDASRMVERSEGGPGGGLGGSVYNEHEAAVVVNLIREALARGLKPSDIGVICLYKAQARRISSMLAYSPPAGTGPSPPSALAGVQVSTVDAFQGMEKEVIIVTTSRTRGPGAGAGASSAGARPGVAPGASVPAPPTTVASGHVDDGRRLNVTLTRARRHCIIVGCARALAEYGVWYDVLLSAASVPGGIRTTGLSPLLQPSTPDQGPASNPQLQPAVQLRVASGSLTGVRGSGHLVAPQVPLMGLVSPLPGPATAAAPASFPPGGPRAASGQPSMAATFHGATGASSNPAVGPSPVGAQQAVRPCGGVPGPVAVSWNTGRNTGMGIQDMGWSGDAAHEALSDNHGHPDTGSGSVDTGSWLDKFAPYSATGQPEQWGQAEPLSEAGGTGAGEDEQYEDDEGAREAEAEVERAADENQQASVAGDHVAWTPAGPAAAVGAAASWSQPPHGVTPVPSWLGGQHKPGLHGMAPSTGAGVLRPVVPAGGVSFAGLSKAAAAVGRAELGTGGWGLPKAPAAPAGAVGPPAAATDDGDDLL